MSSLHALLISLLFVGFSCTEAQQSPVAQYREDLNRYCVTCHNETLKTAGLMLDQANLEDVSQDRQLWERVLVKLTLRAMPPVGMPRPDEGRYEELIAHLESELDRIAQADPNPGSVTVHRLNRAEYTNAIRDLLSIEIDSTVFLPPDNTSQGFDNIAEVLAVSPLLMEQYMFAASKISRLAVGPPPMLPVSETYNVYSSFLQDERASEDLPFGSRGGTVVRHRFPLDAEYVINIKLQRTAEGYIRGMRKQHLVDVQVDHERVGSLEIGGKLFGRSGPSFSRTQDPHYAGDASQVGYEMTGDDVLQVRFPAKAGTRLVGVTFLGKHTKPTGIQTPEMKLIDIDRYKHGDPGVASVTITGPFNATGPGETASRQKIFVCKPASPAEQEPCARTILSTLARQAYRRPLMAEDMDKLLDVYRQGQRLGGFESGIDLALQSILAGPKFLFRIGQDPAGAAPGTVYPISDLDLASRLSFFLWSSIPDEQLLSLAEQGRLREPGVLTQQVKRMMADRRSDGFVQGFGEQFLSLRELDNVQPHPEMFPDFDDELREAFKQETKLWFASQIQEDHSVLGLLTSDYTYVNGRLARHYGIPDIHGGRFRQVSLNGFEERQGLFGKGSVLMATSYNNRTSPVLRGKWVLERLLGMAPPPPPDDAFDFDTNSEDGKALTMRESMEKHRANPVCAGCHKLMDPIGFALENFDAVGTYRTAYADIGTGIDSSGVLFDGSEFQTTMDFRSRMLKHSARVVHVVAEKLLMYAMGRGVEYYDQPVIREIVQKTAPEQYSWLSLIQAVVESKPFQYRRVQ